MKWKMGLAVGVLLFAAEVGRAQTFDEWFSQNSTRLKYDVQQIAAFQVYGDQLEKEYSVFDGGLTLINTSKQGEYESHRQYYTSLETINPEVSQLPEVAEISTLQAAIGQRYSAALARYQKDGILNATWIMLVQQASTTVLSAGASDINTLQDILTPGVWQMTDDQRIVGIKKLAVAMRSRNAFTMALIDRTDLLEQQQGGEGRDLKTVQGLYGGQ